MVVLVLLTVADSCARVSYLPCPLAEKASLCPHWAIFVLLFLISIIKISFSLP